MKLWFDWSIYLIFSAASSFPLFVSFKRFLSFHQVTCPCIPRAAVLKVYVGTTRKYCPYFINMDACWRTYAATIIPEDNIEMHMGFCTSRCLDSWRHVRERTTSVPYTCMQIVWSFMDADVYPVWRWHSGGHRLWNVFRHLPRDWSEKSWIENITWEPPQLFILYFNLWMCWILWWHVFTRRWPKPHCNAKQC